MIIPELGPALGRIALPPATHPETAPVPLDRIRLELATAVFELRDDAQTWYTTGDREAAVEALGRSAWLTAWEAAVRETATLVADLIDERIRAAAAESRLPRRRRERILLSLGERKAVQARLGAGGLGLHAALEELDQVGSEFKAHSADRARALAWQEALTGAARQLESAWIALEEAVAQEWERWTPLVESARRWRRPRWVAWIVTVVVLGVAVYVGLVIGGYLPTPPWLREVVRTWWETWDRIVEPV